MAMIGALLNGLTGVSHSLGIEMTDNYIRICETKTSRRGTTKLLRYTSKEMPNGCMEDGKVLNWEGIEATMKELLSSGKFGTKQLHFAIPSQMVMVRNLKLPDIGHSELRKLVQFEMSHNLRVAFEEPYFDFVKLPKPSIQHAAREEEQGAELCELMVVAAPGGLLMQYRTMFEKLGLRPASFEIKPFSVLRLIEASGTTVRDVQLFVHVGEQHSELSILFDGRLELTRQVEVSFQSIVAKADSSNNEWLQSFSSPETTFKNAIQDLAGELERLLNFYQYTLNNGSKTFRNILLSGELKQMEKVREGLEEELEHPVVILEWPTLDDSSVIADWSLSSYSVALGLSIRGRTS
ncbi:type IV pilus biogenesis protein PilM [Paenibacillus sp. strain BS8-2]